MFKYLNIIFCASVFLIFAAEINAQQPSKAPAKFNLILPACFDSLDNDKDGLIDYPNDLGCENAADNDESEPRAAEPTIIAPVASGPTREIVVKVAVKARATKTYQILDQQVFNNPQVEKATVTIAAPVIAVAAAANAGTAISFASLFAYLQGLFTQPLLLFGLRRRKQWGQVYSSLTKLPIDLAVVRLFSAPSGNVEQGKLLQTRVTDKHGRYLFLTDPGTYIIKVVKPGYTFPSSYLSRKEKDLDFVDLYHGELIAVSARGTALARPIPLDFQEAQETPGEVIARGRQRNIRAAIAWSGPVLAVVAVIITPGLATVSLCGLQIALLGIFKRLANGTKKPKSWTLVKDAETGKPIAQAVARVFDTQFNKLLETCVTDKQGRYAFLLGQGKFYITVEKSGYQQYKSEILDLSKEIKLYKA